MTKGTIFWVLMLLWGLVLVGAYWPGEGRAIAWAPIGGLVLLWVLLFLLGWAQFGFIISNGGPKAQPPA